MPAGRNNFWTPEREAWLRANVKGSSARQLAEELGTTRNAILGKLNRLGLSNRTDVPSLEVRQAARRAYQRAYYWTCKSMPPPVPKCAPEPYRPSGGIPLIDLEPRSCRWPITDGRPPFLYCGQVSATGSSYCPHHWGVSRGGRH